MLSHIVSLLVQISATINRPIALLVKFQESGFRIRPIWAWPNLVPRAFALLRKWEEKSPGDEVGRGSGSFDRSYCSVEFSCGKKA